MQRPLILALAALPGLLAAQPDTNGVNAAAIYWPVLSNLTAWANTHTDYGTFPASNAASPEAARAYDELQPQLAGLAPAADATYCNWGTRFEDGPAAILPYLMPARRGARAALWAADYALSNSLPGFADRALDALRLSRNAGEDQVLIGYLVQMSGETPTLELLAHNLDRLNDAQLERLASDLEKLPPGATLIDAARMEKAMFIDQLLGKMIEAMRLADTNFFELIPAPAASNGTNAVPGDGSSLARDLRLASVVENGLRVWIGFETPQGESFTVARGRPSHGIELLSADVDRGEALISRGTETALVKLQSREIAPVRLRFRSSSEPGGFLGDVLRALGTETPSENLASLSTPEDFLATLRKTSEEYEQWIDAIQRLPLDRFRAWQDEFLAKGTVLTRLLLPAMDKVIEKERALMEARAKLEAAIAARRSARAQP